METEVMSRSPPPEFNFDSACTSPFMTAPSSPSFFTPSSRVSYWDTNQVYQSSSHFDNNFEFDFNFSGVSKRLSVSDADDIFSEGRIKPLKPPPSVNFVPVGSPRSSKSQAKKVIETISPKKKDFDTFGEAIRENKGNKLGNSPKVGNRITQPGSPFRISDILSESEPSLAKTDKNALFLFPKSVWKQYKKWKLKDFLLFRNASEGRKDKITRDAMKNYKSFEEDVKSSSFRSTESSGSVSGSGSGSGSGVRRKGSLSAHETHYTMNRAVQEEMKKKTSLPYKHGLMGLGCLGLEPPVHDFVRSFGSNRG